VFSLLFFFYWGKNIVILANTRAEEEGAGRKREKRTGTFTS
jgi:hypothetical protein